jgi:hypothetical protein
MLLGCSDPGVISPEKMDDLIRPYEIGLRRKIEKIVRRKEHF